MDLLGVDQFEPRPYQHGALDYFAKGGKRAISIWHRRAGKDLTAMHFTKLRALRTVGAYWHVFPMFERARRSIWEGFREDGIRLMDNVFPGFSEVKDRGGNHRKPVGIVKRVVDNTMTVELINGSIWRLMGSDKVETVGSGPKGIVFSEFSQCRPLSWELMRPMLRESRGWAWFITTPRGKNHAHDLLMQAKRKNSGWYWDIKTVHDTALTYASNVNPSQMVDAKAMMEEERAEGMPENLIRQEYECDFNAAATGSIYGELLEALEKSGALENETFTYSPFDVYTAWDLGISKGNQTSIWFFTFDPVSRAPRFIDYYENFGKPVEHYFDIVCAKGYEYVKHYLPHDARARTFITGTSTLQAFYEKFEPSRVDVVPVLTREDGIAASRRLLMKDILFHPRCREGLRALTHYHYAYDEDRHCYGKNPEHDWSSNGADAFRMASVMINLAEARSRPTEDDKPKRPVVMTHYPVSLDELFEARKRQYRD